MEQTATASVAGAEVTDELKLVLTAPQVETLRDWTLQDDGIERFAYIYCERQNDRLLAREIDPIPAEDCAVMESSAVRPDLSVERDRLGGAMEDGLVPIMVHSHPFSQRPRFSALDDDIMESYRNWTGTLYPETPLGFVVVGHRGVDTAVYTDPSDPRRDRLGVDVVGEWMLETPLDAPSTDPDVSVDADRYDRSIRALTDDGQAHVADTTVGIAGLGGLGSMVALQLARLGVQEFVFADPDVVERSNLPRIYGATESDVGRDKVDVVGEQVVRANPDAEVRAYDDRVQDVPAAVLSGCDVVIGAVDRLSARLYCNEFAARHLRYYIDGGVAIETDDDERVAEERGLIQLVAPGVTACLDCLGRNDPEHLRVEELSDEEVAADIERGYLDEDVRSPEPAVTPLNGMAASSITRLFTKLVTGYTPPSDFIRFDGLDDELLDVGTHPSDNCITCGTDELLGVGELEFEPAALVGGDADTASPDTETEPAEARTITRDALAERPTTGGSATDDPTVTPAAAASSTGPATWAIESTAWGAGGSHPATARRQTPPSTPPDEDDSQLQPARHLRTAWERKGLLGLAVLGVAAVKHLWDRS
jgi:molybdopterin/thiamine biosynthesis adenylyltransferase